MKNLHIGFLADVIRSLSLYLRQLLQLFLLWEQVVVGSEHSEEGLDLVVAVVLVDEVRADLFLQNRIDRDRFIR